jgi:hypothetical protein
MVNASKSHAHQLALHGEFADNSGALILQVILADADVPPLLRQFQGIDLRGGDIEKAVSQSLEAILHWSMKREALSRAIKDRSNSSRGVDFDRDQSDFEPVLDDRIQVRGRGSGSQNGARV